MADCTTHKKETCGAYMHEGVLDVSVTYLVPLGATATLLSLMCHTRPRHNREGAQPTSSFLPPVAGRADGIQESRLLRGGE